MRKSILITVSLGVGAAVILGCASQASANTPGTVTVSQPVYAKSAASATVTGVASAAISTKIMQGEYIAAKGYHPKHAKKVYLKKGKSFRNSLMSRSHVVFYFHDVCGSRLSPTIKKGKHRRTCEFDYDSKHHTYRKATCGNWAKLRGSMPRRTYKSDSQVRSFGNITWRDTVRLYEAGTVNATATCKTPGSSASASARASASLYATVAVYVSAKYSTTARSSGAGKVSSTSWAYLASKISVKAQASIKASAAVKCSYTPQPTPPAPTCQPGQTGNYPYCVTPCPTGQTGTYPNCTVPTCPPGQTGTPPYCTTPPPAHYTNVSCKGFEEVTGNGSFLVDCDVSNDNGASIMLTASSDNGYSRVSGINCYSQSGNASCTGNGTYEFRVTGINDGSDIQSSSLTVNVTSNGVPAQFKSDQFPVDPSGGGF